MFHAHMWFDLMLALSALAIAIVLTKRRRLRQHRQVIRHADEVFPAWRDAGDDSYLGTPEPNWHLLEPLSGEERNIIRLNPPDVAAEAIRRMRWGK